MAIDVKVAFLDHVQISQIRRFASLYRRFRAPLCHCLDPWARPHSHNLIKLCEADFRG
ncbi:hypothetical protein JL2886_02032 [Phaeobacter gallaeciensis]|uniref:Uncharacterized protein n=1 Tax=Phaeobacter gallaeciensis TaxID=60890 RepID=A0A1B0ZS15_9RHOB|nr:hypothetical protein JL2886_02032 [Phaeobacter gallaeciensis]